MLISALFYDLVQDKAAQIPKQGKRREHELQELVKERLRYLWMKPMTSTAIRLSG